MKPSQFWWMQILTAAFFAAFVLVPLHEGVQVILALLISVTAIFNTAMDRPETDRQKLTSAGILFVLTATLVPFTWGKPIGWFVLAAFPLSLLSFVMSVRRMQATQTSLSN